MRAGGRLVRPHGECRNLVVVTVSEGIGTGVLANGQLVRGLNGMAGEFGHVPLDPNGSAVRLRQPWLLGSFRVEPRGAAILSGDRRRSRRADFSGSVAAAPIRATAGRPRRWKRWRITWAAECA